MPGTTCPRPCSHATRSSPLSPSANASTGPAPRQHRQTSSSSASQFACRTSPSLCPTVKASPGPSTMQVTGALACGSSIWQLPSSRQTQTAPKWSPETSRHIGVTHTAVMLATWPMYIVPVHSLHSWLAKVCTQTPLRQRRAVMSTLPVATKSPSSAEAKHVTFPRCPSNSLLPCESPPVLLKASMSPTEYAMLLLRKPRTLPLTSQQSCVPLAPDGRGRSSTSRSWPLVLAMRMAIG
mmetsp:Transcript_18248/g.41247  ORF Transcript_18248/g.41247 Transcript_18248/m.41247 type:complete len:238 (-) Transcript_18248:442-1155(-)